MMDEFWKIVYRHWNHIRDYWILVEFHWKTTGRYRY